MDNFKQASKEKLRIPSKYGTLSVEQLWDLPITELDELAVALETEHKQSGKRSFVVKTTPKDKTAKLRFDIVLEVLNTKVAEEEANAQRLEDKRHNERIDALIADKQDEELKGKSIQELKGMRRK